MFAIEISTFPESIIAEIASKTDNPFSMEITCRAFRDAICHQRDYVFRRIWQRCKAEFVDTISIEQQAREILQKKELSPFEGVCFLGNFQRRERENLSSDRRCRSFLPEWQVPEVYGSLFTLFCVRESWILNVNVFKFAAHVQRWHTLVPHYEKIFQSKIPLGAKTAAYITALKCEKRATVMTDLVLEGAGLTRLPRLISLFPSLEKLYIFRNKISGLPTDIFSHNLHIKRVSLGTNQIQHLQYVMFPRNCRIYIKNNPFFATEKNLLRKKKLACT